MASIQIDDTTAASLLAIAAANGMSVEDYLRSLVVMRQTSSDGVTPEEFDRELDRLTFAGPALPADFSRADIYADRD